MAHELDFFTNGKARIAYRGDVPWHGLGQKVLEEVTRKEFLELAGCDFTVSKRKLFAAGPDGTPLTRHVSGHSALVRDDNGFVLDVVSDRYKVIQSEQFFQAADEFLEDKSVSIETAGVLKKGQHVWLLCKLGESFTVAGGRDQSDAYLLLSNTFKAGVASTILLTPVRVVCNNTVTLALADEKGRRASFAHWDHFDAEKAKEIVGIGKAGFKAFAEKAEFLTAKRAKNEDFVSYIKRVYALREPAPFIPKDAADGIRQSNQNTIDRLKDICLRQPGADIPGVTGTWWNAYNSITFDTDHIIGRGTDGRLASAWYGQGAVRKQRALTLAVDYAQAE
jgi:phage/plasmid-like protein (TIGR03299 family)